MRRPSRALLVVPVLSLVLAGCGGSQDSDDGATPPTTGSVAGGTALKIAGFAYDPSPLTVAPGATINVTNSDGATHDVKSDDQDLFKSSDVEKGKTVSFTAPTKPGTYTYICTYHSNMKGELIVK